MASTLQEALAFAVQHHQAGRLTVAEPIYRQILARYPDHPDALHFLGLLVHQTGRHEESVEHIERAIRLCGTQAAYHNNLGGAYRALQKLDQAAASYLRAIQLEPHRVEAHKNLGAVRNQQGRYDLAAACYQRALQLQPADADAHNGLAIASIHDGRFAEAIICSRRALQLRPDFAEAHNALGSARCRLGKLEEAAKCFRQALALKPDYLDALENLGIVCTALKLPQEAADCFRRARDLAPPTADAQFGLGRRLEEVGDFDGAERCWREALHLAPGHPYALAELAKMRPGSVPEADLIAMRQVVAAPDLSVSERSSLHFGLAHVLDARGDFSAAAEHLVHANSLKSTEHREQGCNYDPGLNGRLFGAVIEHFSREHFARVAGFGVESERPVFIFGLPRSGTTLIEQILAGHSQIFAPGELELGSAAFESLPSRTNSGLSGAESVSRLNRPAVVRLAGEYLDWLAALDDVALRIVDKAPGNYLYLGLLATLFPKARLIHCRRDVRDVALSCWMADFRYLNWSNDWQHIGTHVECYRRIMEHWRNVLPVPMLEVDYESTVVDLEGTARRLIDWCGLAWEPACLNFHERRQPVRTASVRQVRQPVYRQSVGRWKNYEVPLAGLFSML